MNPSSLTPDDDEICSRTYRLARADGDVDVHVRLLKPKPWRDSDDFHCEFQITGLTDHKRIAESALGVDTMQAVEIALLAVRSYLKPFENDLRFSEGSGVDFSEFPTPIAGLSELERIGEKLTRREAEEE